MSLIPTEKIDLWLREHLNVHLEGEHGVGKTELTLEAFRRHNLNYLYFSSAEMDPWIDLVGVPREREEIRDGKKVEYIELIPPRQLAYDDVDIIFFDEYNRAPEKVRNATMQFIQFKQVNGRKFNRLKAIWIATNPSETARYDVHELDPAQADRFQVKYVVPTRCDEEYFQRKYGNIGVKFVQWWDSLDAEVKRTISPRRVEYGVKMYLCDGDLEDVFGPKVNTADLENTLSQGTVQDRVAALMSNPKTTPDDIRRFIYNENNFSKLKPVFATVSAENRKIFEYFAPYIEPEKAVAMCNNEDAVTMIDRFTENAGLNPENVEVLKQHADKKEVIPALLEGLVGMEFGFDETAGLKKEEDQEKILQHIAAELAKKTTPNALYAAAYVLENATQWDGVKKGKTYKTYRSALAKHLEAHEPIKKVFEKALAS